MSSARGKRKAVEPSAGASRQRGGGGPGGKRSGAGAGGGGLVGGSSAGAPHGSLWAISCSRKSTVVEWDEETFVDAYEEEITDLKEQVTQAAVAAIGEWYVTGSSEACGRPGAQRSGTSGAASLLVFSSLEGANAKAAAVWAEMQVRTAGVQAWWKAMSILPICRLRGCALPCSLPTGACAC